MRYSDVKEKHIYNIDFNPVRQSEFNDKHLAIVIKKNEDKRTAIVVPLTKSSNGNGVNKVNIGKIKSLPSNLKNRDSYVVFNQIRTVNVNRFYALKDDNGNRIDVNIDDTLYGKILSFCLDELGNTLSDEGKIHYYYSHYVNLIMEKVINIAYDIKRLNKTNLENKEIELEHLQHLIISLLSSNIEYNNYITDIDKNNGILDIIEKCLDNTIIEQAINPDLAI